MYMADPGKGGKGKKAPYHSTLVRVSLPLKPLVRSLIFAWRNQLGSILDTNGDSLRSQVESALAAASPEHIAVNELECRHKAVNNLDQRADSSKTLQSENAFLLKQLEASVRLIGCRLLEMALREEQTPKKQEMAIAKLAEENSSLRQQLNDLALRAESWACRAQGAEAQLQLLQEQQSPAQSVELA